MLFLHSPHERFGEALLAAARDYVRSGESEAINRYQPALDDFPAYLQRLRELAAGVALAPGWVPVDHFWLIEDDVRLIGVSRLRPRLTAALEQHGGHIGYDIAPGMRRRGYGMQLLRSTLPHARQAGLSEVLLTTNASNTASIRIIEANGGCLQSASDAGSPPRPTRRYIIDLNALPDFHMRAQL